VDGSRTVDYRELEESADRLADSLATAGVASGQPVGVSTHTRYEWTFINHALAKLGCSQVLVNWRFTVEEIRYILQDSRAAAFIVEGDATCARATQDLVAFVATVDPVVNDIPNLPELIRQGRATGRESSAPARLVKYTSGTTGRPKGTGEPPRPTDEEHLRRIHEYLSAISPMLAEERVLLTMPLHHGGGPAITAMTLMKGGTVYLMDRYDPSLALAMITEHKITSWTCVPTMLNRIKALPAEVLEAADVSSLTRIKFGGSASPPSLVEWAISYFGPVLEQTYGASEVSGISQMDPSRQGLKPGSVGRPLPHVDIRIVDKEGKKLPSGTVGEIEVKTPMTITAYVGRARADELQPDGFFRLGDLGYIDDDGDIFITGRSKDMIIAGGVNIYPAEIEAALVEHPDIVDAAVFGIPHDDFGEQVAAYCEAKPGHSKPSLNEIREFLSSRLAAYKVPRVLEYVDELPRNSTEKILKGELSEPYWTGVRGPRATYNELTMKP
jgi:long-chain acyl-CoA synthetase